MAKQIRIILLGANGCGKTTLGHELGRVLNIAHFDVEKYYFNESEIPYTLERSKEERNEMLLSDMRKNNSFVLSGDISGWGEEFLTMFDLVIYLKAPTNIRMERIESREIKRWGARVCKGGDMYELQMEFRQFAATRDISDIEKVALKFNCPTIYLDGTKLIDELTSYIVRKTQVYFRKYEKGLNETTNYINKELIKSIL